MVVCWVEMKVALMVFVKVGNLVGTKDVMSALGSVENLADKKAGLLAGHLELQREKH